MAIKINNDIRIILLNDLLFCVLLSLCKHSKEE